jgi:hypothetical protein
MSNNLTEIVLLTTVTKKMNAYLNCSKSETMFISLGVPEEFKNRDCRSYFVHFFSLKFHSIDS